jgi:uncharacterized membrane protein
MSEIFGLPAHPMLVHLPVVFTPLALIGLLIAMIRPSLQRTLEPIAIVMVALSAIAAQLAVSSGESLQERLDPSKLIKHHAQLGETTRTLIWVFFAVVVIKAIATRLARRPKPDHPDSPLASTPMRIAMAATVVLVGVAANVWVLRTGHSGAKAVWLGTPSERSGEAAR